MPTTKRSKESSRQINYGSTEVVAETPDHEKVPLKLNNLRLFSNGMFSNVYRGKIVDAKSHDPTSVAVKKCWSKSDSSLTEARIFGRLHHHKHKNIVHLLYMFETHHDDRTCYGLVFEFLPSTLHTYVRQMRKEFNGKPNIIEVKLLAWQLFRGQTHLINQKIIHRDLKPQNILVNPDTGLLKIGDFGSSKFFLAGEPNHSYHVTRYYRAPELILKASFYGPEIDVWSCGCVLGEMLKGTVMWVGHTTEHQLHLIAATLGEPNESLLLSF
uniref:Protein kinase domain-containing protein n=1 Tax=Panagrolaimus superbus TaxID=310955 RepID=A0A914ZEW6_9BILA